MSHRTPRWLIFGFIRFQIIIQLLKRLTTILIKSMNKIGLIIFFFSVLTFGLAFKSCTSNSSKAINLSNGPFQKLSEYNFFGGDIKDLNPNQRILAYDLNTPLFSDYAHKARFVWLPEGTSAQVDSSGNIQFPNQTILIKNFFYQHDERDLTAGRRILETRLLIKNEEAWDAHTYIWNETQTDAELSIIGDVMKVNWIDLAGESIETDYIVPNKNQCKGCHDFGGKLIHLGPKIANLDREYNYEEGSKNQLDKWREMNYLKEYDTNIIYPKFPEWDDVNADLHQRAMAYLDVNCGSCHNPNGPANTSGLNLVFKQEKDIQLGIFKGPVASGKGSGGRSYNIVPGEPENSILVYRMESTDPGAMMPELGRRLVHKEGVELIKEWITKM